MASERDRTYSVSWRSPDGEVTTCTNLTARIAFARLWAEWRRTGEIVVLDVQPEWLAGTPTPPSCQDESCSVATGFLCDACTLWFEENAALL